jgi:ankyrin repeat protein
LEARDAVSLTPFALAVQRENKAIVELLLEKGPNREARDAEGPTPLALAILQNQALVKLLLETGGNTVFLSGLASTLDLQGRLHEAVKAGNLNVVRLQLVIGSDLEERNTEGLTPLALAILGDHEVVRKISVEQGAQTKVWPLNDAALMTDRKIGFHKVVQPKISKLSDCFSQLVPMWTSATTKG